MGQYTSKNYWITTSRAPCLPGASPHENTQPLCGHTQPHCGTIYLKLRLETNLHSPMFIRGCPPPPSTYTTTVWAHGTTVLVNTPQKTPGKNCHSPMFPRGPPPLNTHNHCVGTCNHCVGQYTSKHYWKTTFIAPCLSGVSPHPPSTHTTTVCAHGTTVCVNTPKKPTGKQPS